MNKIIVVNTCTSQERLRQTLGIDFVFRVAQHPPLTCEFISLIKFGVALFYGA